mmetsp:Transcript_6217/g.9523  ORF Transcript_6217/g.9523 Transcript_6217/m.9523 type:complete len:242 (+) Transcript_6217:84-809(+)
MTFPRLHMAPKPALRSLYFPTHTSTKCKCSNDNGLQEARRDRRIRKGGIAASLFILSSAISIEGLLINNPSLAFSPLAILSSIFVASRLPVYIPNPPLKLNEDVEIRDSPGRGMGVFSKRRIVEGTYLFDYIGEHLDEAMYLERYPPNTPGASSDYVVDLTNGDPFALDPIFIDGANTNASGLARWINHGADEASRNVRRQHQHWPTRVMRLFAARDIEPGEELMYDYGTRYWEGREDMVR